MNFFNADVPHFLTPAITKLNFLFELKCLSAPICNSAFHPDNITLLSVCLSLIAQEPGNGQDPLKVDDKVAKTTSSINFQGGYEIFIASSVMSGLNSKLRTSGIQICLDSFTVVKMQFRNQIIFVTCLEVSNMKHNQNRSNNAEQNFVGQKQLRYGFHCFHFLLNYKNYLSVVQQIVNLQGTIYN